MSPVWRRSEYGGPKGGLFRADQERNIAADGVQDLSERCVNELGMPCFEIYGLDVISQNYARDSAAVRQPHFKGIAFYLTGNGANEAETWAPIVGTLGDHESRAPAGLLVPDSRVEV